MRIVAAPPHLRHFFFVRPPALFAPELEIVKDVFFDEMLIKKFVSSGLLKNVALEPERKMR